MKRSFTLLCVTAAWIAGGSAVAQGVFNGGFASSAQRVQTEVKFSQDNAQPGSSVEAAVLLTIQESWHINAHIPSEDYLIGTTLRLEPREGVIVADVRYPQGHPFKFAFADRPLNVYEGTIPIYLTLRLSEKLEPGPLPLRGTLEVQACDDQVCLAPSALDVELPLNIVPAGTPVTALDEELFAAYDANAPTRALQSDNELARLFETEGSLAAFVAIFLIGLALNLTPCVYPMMSVTVSLFGAQSDTHTVRVFLKAVVYVLGIATMYSVLGVTAALSGGLFGSWLQSPWVLGLIAALLFGLALSMFGVYQLQVPYWITSRLGGTTGTGVISLYLSGLVVGVFAAPCIGPPVIALLALVGAKGDPVFGFWAFFLLSLGLGFPYLILGTFSGLLKKVPRSGDWLVWVERIFGVILIGAALFYLSLAIAPKLAAYVPAFVLIVGGIYLGFLEHSGRGRKVLQRIKWAFGLGAVAIGLMFANDLRQPTMTWQPYDEEWLEEARAAGRPTIIDFYADWCIPCLELDRGTFTNERVIEAAESFVRLKVDLTYFDSPESEALRKQFNVAGVPTIVFLDPSGREVEEARVIGYVPPAEFLARMELVITD